MRQRPTRAAHDSRASTRSGRGTPLFAASCLDARPAPIAPAPPATRGHRRFESACATVPGRRHEVQHFLYTDFVLTRLATTEDTEGFHLHHEQQNLCVLCVLCGGAFSAFSRRC